MPETDTIAGHRAADFAHFVNELDVCPMCNEDAGLYEVENPNLFGGFSVTLHCVCCDAQRGGYG